MPVLLFILKSISFVFGHMPLGLAIFIGRGLGFLAYVFLRKHRRIAADNLNLAYKGALTEEETRAIVRKVFANIGITAAETLRIPWIKHADLHKYVSCDGLDNLRAALAKGRGVIILTGHFGNWELQAAYFGLAGFPMDVVVRELDSPLIDAFVRWIRCSGGNRIVLKNRSMRKLMKVLSDNGIALILVDQNVASAEGVFVDYFGTLACTNKGPAMLAAAVGAAVLPTFLVRKGSTHHLIIGQEIKLVVTGDKSSDTLVNTAAFTRSVEQIVRQYPEQWFWVHRRWKTRPSQKSL